MSKEGRVNIAGKDDGCCGVFFLKYVLFVFNIIFWISGLGILGIGLWTLLDKHHYVHLLSTSTYVATTYLLIGTGAIIIIVGIIGCVGWWKENRCCLMVYATFLLLIFLLEAVAGIMAYMYESTVHDELLRHLNTTMLENYSYDLDKTRAIDELQRDFKCCGSGNFMDWRSSKWKVQNEDLPLFTPTSCCKTESNDCAERDHPSNIYYDGCVIRFENYLKDHLIILGAVGIGICCLQIFGIVFACCLAKKLKEYEERADTNYW